MVETEERIPVFCRCSWHQFRECWNLSMLKIMIDNEFPVRKGWRMIACKQNCFALMINLIFRRFPVKSVSTVPSSSVILRRRGIKYKRLCGSLPRGWIVRLSPPGRCTETRIDVLWMTTIFPSFHRPSQLHTARRFHCATSVIMSCQHWHFVMRCWVVLSIPNKTILSSKWSGVVNRYYITIRYKPTQPYDKQIGYSKCHCNVNGWEISKFQRDLLLSLPLTRTMH